MKQKLVYDFPTRVFHWMFVALFCVAYGIGNFVDDENPIYSYHMLAGLTLLSVVAIRLVWGFTGSKFARFSSFRLHFKELIDYFVNLLAPMNKTYMEHNPASSWASLVMMVCAILLGISGIIMSQGENKSVKEVHEIIATLFVLTATTHIAGIIVHTIIRKDPIGLSMVSGKKTLMDESHTPITETHRPLGLAYIVVVLLIGGVLLKNYSSETRQLHLLGQTLQLGEKDKQGEGASQIPPEADEDHQPTFKTEDND